MDATLIFLNAVMAIALWWKPKCKMFAAIQCLQILETPLMIHSTAYCWIFFEPLNIAMGLISIYVTTELKISRWLLLLWCFLAANYHFDKDCAYQMVKNFETRTMDTLNIVILLTLLVYAFYQPTLRLRSYIARKISSLAYAPS